MQGDLGPILLNKFAWACNSKTALMGVEIAAGDLLTNAQIKKGRCNI